MIPSTKRLAVHVHGKHAERAGGLVLVGDPLDDRHLLAAGLAENRPEDQQVGALGSLIGEDEGLPVQILHGEIGGRLTDLEGFDALDHRYGGEGLLLGPRVRRSRSAAPNTPPSTAAAIPNPLFIVPPWECADRAVPRTGHRSAQGELLHDVVLRVGDQHFVAIGVHRKTERFRERRVRPAQGEVKKPARG